MKYVLVTGADGFLGGKFIKRILDDSGFGVIAVTDFVERLPEMISRTMIKNTDKMTVMSTEEMLLADLTTFSIEGAVHFAFSRAVFPNKDIANSLDYCLKVYGKIVDSNIKKSIYMSSQSVYGDYEELRSELVPPAPNSVYAMAKYAGEKIIEACYRDKKDLQYTFVRLDNVIESQNLVRSLCRNAKDNGCLKLTGGKQVFSYIAADEVPSALLALLTTSTRWKHIYNVGADCMRATLVDVAKAVQMVAAQYGTIVTVDLVESDTKLWAGMNIDSFKNDTGWSPEKDLIEMVRQVYLTV